MPLAVDKYLKLSPRHRRVTAPETENKTELDPANVIDRLPNGGLVEEDPTSAELDPYRRELAALRRGHKRKKPLGP